MRHRRLKGFNGVLQKLTDTIMARQNVDPMLVSCLVSVADGRLTLHRHWINVTVVSAGAFFYIPRFFVIISEILSLIF